MPIQNKLFYFIKRCKSKRIVRACPPMSIRLVHIFPQNCISKMANLILFLKLYFPMNFPSKEFLKIAGVYLHIPESNPSFHFPFYPHFWFWSVDPCSSHSLDISALLFLKAMEFGVPLPKCFLPSCSHDWLLISF